MSEDPHRDVLARISRNQDLARAVPLLRPEVLHAVITHCGLQDCGELLALATSEQLSAVFDLDLWKVNRAGEEEQFDAARFCEWLEVLVDAGPAGGGGAVGGHGRCPCRFRAVAEYPGLRSRSDRPGVELNGADAVSNAGRERGVSAEIGGYVVVERRPGAWDAIVDVLLALHEHHSDTFHRVMRACRRLSNAGWELDGLDDLLPDEEQARLDVSLSREQRQNRLGFLPTQQARAFLDSARRVPLTAVPPGSHPVFTAYRRSLAVSEPEIRFAAASAEEAEEPASAAHSAAISVIEVLRSAGVLAEAPRALLPGAADEGASVNPSLNRYLQRWTESDHDGWTRRNQELGFLANALVGACSLQGRSFTRREAVDAASAMCNLGLDHWPPQWPASSDHDLVTIFQVGWSVLHREVSMVAAAYLLTALDGLRVSDRDLQVALHALRRELDKQRQAGTPWHARSRLDLLATFDLSTWAALAALFDECPVMLANVSAPQDRQPHTVTLSEFQFIADARHIAAVHDFLRSVPERLAS
jgi:hypothetical protein